MKLYLIRHGQSIANLDKTVYFEEFDHNISLSEQGRTQAKELGQMLSAPLFGKEIVMYVSPYNRTVETAALISEGLKNTSIKSVIYNPIIREHEWAMVDNISQAEAMLQERETFGRFWYRFDGFESEADVYLRAQTFFNDLRIKKLLGELPEHVVIVSHHVFLSCLIGVIKSTHPDNIILDLKNCIPFEIEL